MRRCLDDLTDRTFDLLVVGGGFAGSFAALDAAQRGLRVALVDCGDFGASTSASSLGILHGGIRYLLRFDAARYRQCDRELRAWFHTAPHLTSPLPVFVPTRTGALRLGAAVLDAASRIGRRTTITRAAVSLVPASAAAERLGPHSALGTSGGFTFWDGQLSRPERAIVEILDAAVQAGAVVANYVRVTGASRASPGDVRIRAADELLGTPLVIRSRSVVNATGPAARATASTLGAASRVLPADHLLSFNVAVSRPLSPSAIVLFARRRQFVAVPWRGRMVVGTAHYPNSHEVTPIPTPAQIGQFVDDINSAWPNQGLRPDDIEALPAGLIPVTARPFRRTAMLSRALIVDHATDGQPHMISLVVEKLTTARQAAETAVDLVFRKLGHRRPPRCRTAHVPLPGASDDLASLRGDARRRYGSLVPHDVLENLLATYGARYEHVLRYRHRVAGWDDRVVEGGPVIFAQLVHAVLDEAAQTSDDLLLRRTGLGCFGRPPDAAMLAAGRALSAAYAADIPMTGDTPRSTETDT